jgi:hypothetical protein
VSYSPRLSPLEDRELLSPLFPATTLLAAGEIADQAFEGFNYMYGPSVMADETDGMYKVWTVWHKPGAPLGDNIGFKEAPSLSRLIDVPTEIALSPSGDASKFDQIHTSDPTVYRDPNDGSFYLAYDGNTDGTQLVVSTRIGIAHSTDGGHTFVALYNGTASNGYAVVSPGANFAGGYGVGQPAVVRANDGLWYMLYTDSPGGSTPEAYQVIRSSVPTFSTYNWVATIPKSLTQAASLDLAYDPIKGDFVVIGDATSVYTSIGTSCVRLCYFDSSWRYLGQQVITETGLGFSFGEGVGLLKTSQGHVVNSQILTFASGTINPWSRASSNGAWWVGGNLSYFSVSLVHDNPYSGFWRDVATGDFTGDGRLDLVGRTNYGQWWVGMNTGSGFVNQLWTTWNEAANWQDVRVGDFDGDGKADIAGRTASGDWWVAISTGLSFINEYWGHWNPNATWVDVMVGDFNGDGQADIVGRYMQAGQWWVAQSTGSSFTNSLWATWNPNVNWADANVGDFNGDGKADITGRWADGGWWYTGISTGSSFSTSAWAFWNPNVTWVDVNVGDFDGDGKTDIVGRWLQGGQWWVGLSTGSAFTSSLWATWNANVTWVDIKVGDFKGDGKTDITGRWLESGSWWTGISTGSSFTTTLWTTWSAAATWADVQVGDFTGDGQADIIGRWLEGGVWYAGISATSSFTTRYCTCWHAG